MRLLVVLSAVLFLAPSLARADNPHLDRARADLDQLKFEEAKASLAAALRQGGSSPEELAEIYRLSGQVAAALGDGPGAEDSFQRLLVLQPDTKLPPGTSPKITAPFAAAATRMQGTPPLSVRAEWGSEWPPVVRVVVESDPLHLVSGAEVVWWIAGGSPQRLEAQGDELAVTIPLEAPPAERVFIAAAALDRFGNRVRLHGTAEAPLVIWAPPPAVPAEPVVERHARPFYARPYFWGGITLGFLAVGGYYAFKVSSTQDELDEIEANGLEHDYSDWRAVKERGDREALLANVSFGVAGAFAIVTTILVVRDLTAKEESVRAEPVALPGGGGAIFVTGRW